MHLVPAPLRGLRCGLSLPRARWLRALYVVRACLAGLAAGVLMDGTLQFQPLLPDIAGRFGVPLWQVALANVAALIGCVAGTGAARSLAVHYEPRRLAAASAGLTAWLLGVMATADGTPALILVAPLLGVVNQGLVLVQGRFLDHNKDDPLYKLVQGVVILGVASGLFLGRWLDAVFATPGFGWRGGLVSQAIASALMAGLVLALVPKGGRAGELAPIARHRPDAVTRNVGATLLWSQATLVLFDSSQVLLLWVRGLSVQDIGVLSTTFIVGAAFAPLATAALERRAAARWVLIGYGTIALAWPLVGVALVAPPGAYLLTMWLVGLPLEVATTGLRVVAPLVLVMLYRGRAFDGIAVSAYLNRRVAVGQLVGAALQVLMLFGVARASEGLLRGSPGAGAARPALGLAVVIPLVAVGIVLGAVAVLFLRRVWLALPREARGSSETAVLGISRGLGHAVLMSIALLAPQLAGHFGAGAAAVLALAGLGWAAAALTLRWLLRPSRVAGGRAAIVGAALLGAAGAVAVATATTPAIVAAGVVALGCSASAPAIALGAARRRWFGAGENPAALDAGVESWRRVVELGAPLVLGLLAGLGGFAGEWRWPYLALAAAFVVQAAFWWRRRLPPEDARSTAHAEPSLRRMWRRPAVRSRLLATGALGCASQAAFAPLAILIATRGGFGDLTFVVVAVLASVGILATPIPLIVAPALARRRAGTGRAALTVAAWAGVSLGVLALAQGWLLVIGIGLAFVVAQAAIGIGRAALTATEVSGDQVSAAAAADYAHVIGSGVGTLVAAGLVANFSIWSRAEPATVAGVGWGDLGPALALAIVALAAAAARRWTGARPRRVDAAERFDGRGELVLTVPAAAIESHEHPLVVAIAGGESTGSTAFQLGPDESVLASSTADGVRMFAIGSLVEPVGVASGWSRPTEVVLGPGRWLLPTDDRHARLALTWWGESSFAVSSEPAKLSSEEVEALCRIGVRAVPGAAASRVRIRGRELDDSWHTSVRGPE